MNVCYICNEYPEGPHGGVGTMTKLLAEELCLRNHSVKVIGVYDLSYPSKEFELKNGVEITRIKINYNNRISVASGYLKMARKIRTWINKNEIDIIEAPDSYGIFSLFANFKRPLILRANGNNTYFSSILNIPLKKNTAFYERNLYRKAFGYCAVSNFTADKMKALFLIKDPISVIYNAVEMPDMRGNQIVETEGFRKISEFSNPIVFSGTLTPKKGIYELVNSVIILLEKGIDVTLLINGKDSVNINTGQSVQKELLALIPLKFKNNIVFNGHVTRNELIYQYKSAKAAIFPSFAEAFAFAPMEAMAAGIPTIFSKDCSGEELINDKEDGLLIDPSNLDTMVQAMEYILLNPEKAAQIAEKGKEKIRLQFSKELMANKSIEFYETIIAKFFDN
jgi:glycosyltransferase involved in cell wall biosynthesis